MTGFSKLLHIEESSPVRDRRIPAVMILLAVVTVITFANSLGNGFVWDDHQILALPEGGGFPSFSSMFGVDTVFHDEPVPYYRPLHRLIHLLELKFFGLDPRPFHAVNILLHTANVLLLFRLSLIFFESLFPAMVTALLFAVHPVNCEGVNFITSRQNMLALFFTLSAALVYLRHFPEHRFWKSCLAALLFLGGLFCKETALMPLVFLVTVFLFMPESKPGSRWSSIRSLTPFALALALYAILRTAAVPISQAQVITSKVSFWDRVGYNLYTLPKYMFNLTFPVKLSAYYQLPVANLFGDPSIVVGWLLSAALLGYLLYRRTRLELLVLLWLVINWLPISNIVPIPSAPMADRYLYLPATGLWILAGSIAGDLHQRVGRNRLIPMVVVSLTVVLAALSVQRNRVWKDDISLFTSILKNEPQSATASYNLGNALFMAGRHDEARAEFENSIRIKPDYDKALNALGNLALMADNLLAAEQYYQKCLASNPGNSEAHFNLATIYERIGRYREAYREYEMFLRRVPPEHAHLVPEIRQKFEVFRRKLE